MSGFIADFYCSKLLLVIEVDGEIHNKQKEYDEERSKVLNDLGIFVMRFSNEQVLNDIDWVREEIKKQIFERSFVLGFR